MPRVIRRTAIVAGLTLATAVCVLAGPVIDGRRWEAARPTVAEPVGALLASSPPIGRRWV